MRAEPVMGWVPLQEGEEALSVDQGGRPSACPEERPHQDLTTLAPGSWASGLQNCEKADFSRLVHPVCGVLLRQPSSPSHGALMPSIGCRKSTAIVSLTVASAPFPRSLFLGRPYAHLRSLHNTHCFLDVFSYVSAFCLFMFNFEHLFLTQVLLSLQRCLVCLFIEFLLCFGVPEVLEFPVCFTGSRSLPGFSVLSVDSMRILSQVTAESVSVTAVTWVLCPASFLGFKRVNAWVWGFFSLRYN